MSFSERYGYKNARNTIQLESIDEPLKNGLWSLLQLHIWDKIKSSAGGYFISDQTNQELNDLCKKLWFSYFHKPLDTLDHKWINVLNELRKYFFQCEWYEVYDFIEFVSQNYKRYRFLEFFTPACNNLLEREMSAYRLIDGVITRMTEQSEIDEIDSAIQASDDPVSAHLHRSLELLSDRNSPDYRNSIKESISAVESLVTLILNDDRNTLGQLLNKLEDEVGLHPALKTAFSNLYGYTSDAGGIRHALTEQDNTDFNDAKLMLVVCSAFINFVNGKYISRENS